MTKHNLLREIQSYSNLAYVQGEKVGSGIITLKESREEEGFKRLIKFMRIANIIKEVVPQEGIEAINNESVQ